MSMQTAVASAIQIGEAAEILMLAMELGESGWDHSSSDTQPGDHRVESPGELAGGLTAEPT